MDDCERENVSLKVKIIFFIKMCFVAEMPPGM
jgi:hypothetical protein